MAALGWELDIPCTSPLFRPYSAMIFRSRAMLFLACWLIRAHGSLLWCCLSYFNYLIYKGFLCGEGDSQSDLYILNPGFHNPGVPDSDCQALYPAELCHI